MIKDFTTSVKYTLGQVKFLSKRDTEGRLTASFGELKEESFDFECIESYFRSKDNSKAFQVLSDKTCNDLDFQDFFKFIDRTHSKVGQQYLYNRLRAFNPDSAQTHLNEQLITQLTENQELRISTQKKLEKLKHKDAYNISSLFQEEHIKPPSWFWAIKLLSFAALASLILSFFSAPFFILLLGVFCANFIIHYWNKRNLVKYVSSIPQLFRLNGVAAHLFNQNLFKNLNPNLHQSITLLNGIKSRMSFFQLEARLQGEFEIVFWFIFEILKTLFLLEPLLLFGVLKRLDTKRNEIETLFQFVGHIDMLISVAALRSSLKTFCLPKITDEDSIKLEAIYHPLIYNCTTNDMSIINKSILLTGSNMSGKTSFIRAIGLNIISGLSINTCFAKSMSFPLTRVHSAIRISDDLMNDKSYYFEEVLTIKEILQESQKPPKNLFLLDELFKGTNTVERIAAGKAILSALSKNNKVLVSTHDIELTDMLGDSYDLYHFSETVNGKNVGFDYKLKEGKLKNRNAIKILEINDYPKEIIQEAFATAKELDKTYLTTNTGM